MIREVHKPLQENPHWSQWFPVYGVYRANKALNRNEPSLMDLEGHKFRFYGAGIYHAVTSSIIGCTVFFGAVAGLEAILK
jgi:hypothetical protein